MPRAPWVRRRRTTDSPRPTGPRWAGRIRQGGSRARQAILVRVARRRYGYQPGRGQRDTFPGRLIVPVELDPALVAPVSPAMPPVGPAPATGMAVPLLPGERSTARRIRFGIANGCTIGSLLLGMSAIFLAMQHDIRIAAVSLLGCVVFDGLDGALARKLGVASPFGAQMDSLADMTSFGIATPVVVYCWLRGTAPTIAVAAACALVAASAAIRLARFNVSPKDGRFFCGVPTTMTAAVLSLAALIGAPLPGMLTAAVVALLAVAMVSSFPYAKLARIAKLPPWFWLAPVIGALVDYRISFFGLVGLYLISGPLVWLRQRRPAPAG